jgi:hypothetical protein
VKEQPGDGVISPEYLTACVRRLLEGEDALVLTAVVTNSRVVAEHMRANRPGSVIHHGGGSLGWAGGAAVGAKFSPLQVHPTGAAAANDDSHVSLEPEIDMPVVAQAAGGAYGLPCPIPLNFPMRSRMRSPLSTVASPPW